MKNRRVEIRDKKIEMRMKEKIMKGFLALFVCFCFVGLSETSKADHELGHCSANPRKNLKGCRPMSLIILSSDESEFLYRIFCVGGDFSACNLIGVLEHQRGNIDKATIFYRKSCDGGDLTGCFNLGELEREYRQSCAEGDLSGCHSLGELEYFRGNYEKAEAAYRKACDGGDLEGCDILRLLLEDEN